MCACRSWDGSGVVAVPDLALNDRTKVAKKSARKTTIRVPYTVSMVVLVVAVVIVIVFVTKTGCGTEVHVEVVRLVCVTVE
jgi:hypothetical protein